MQAKFIQRKEVIRCLMVQLRGRIIPFGRSAAEHISDAAHGMKATSGSGRPTADPCLRAADSIQRPFSRFIVPISCGAYGEPIVILAMQSFLSNNGGIL